MRLIRIRSALLLAGGALLAVFVARSEACSHHREVVIQYVTQYVPQYVPQYITRYAYVPTTPEDSNTQVVRALIIVDDNSPDERFNEQVHSDGFAVLSMLYGMPERCPNPTVLATKEVTRERILEEINYRMKVGPDDTLFVYYIGHGAQYDDKKNPNNESFKKNQQIQFGHFFDLQIRKPNSIGRLYRYELLEAMKNRRAKTEILVTDACFTAAAGADDTEIRISRFKPAKNTKVINNKESIFEHLFLDQRGLVNINSCRPEQKALGNVFTPIFVKQLTNWTGTANPTWVDFFDSVSKETTAKSQELVDKGQVELGEGNEKITAQTPFNFGDWKDVADRLYSESDAPTAPAPPVPATAAAPRTGGQVASAR